MAEARKTFLFSIHSRFSEPLYAGRKVYEFRRKLPKGLSPGDRIILYETAPIGMVTGEFTVGRIGYYSNWKGIEVFEKIDRDLIAVASDGCLVEQELLNYSRRREEGGDYYSFYAIGVRKPIRYKKPLTLADFSLGSAPQSFMRLEEV